MHRDGRQLRPGETLQADVCIVGAGAAGMVLAQELGQRGQRVVLIEAGQKRRGGKSQRLYAGETSDPQRHLTPDRDRFRGLGGSTQAWGGRCMPFDAIDFAARPDLDIPGWPIAGAELEPWYRKAHPYMDCGPYEYTAADAGLGGHLIDGFESEAVRADTLERWSPPTHFGKALFPALAALGTVTVVTNAVATDLHCTPGTKRVSEVRLKTLPKLRDACVVAKTVILAGGGLETTRLLLNGAARGHLPLDDTDSWLGRGYMCHVMGTIARINLNPGTGVIFGFEKDADGVYVRRRLTISETVLRERSLPNLYALLDRPLMSDANHGSAVLSLAYLAKRVLQPQSRTGSADQGSAIMNHLRNLIFGAPQALSVLPRFGRERFLRGRRLPSLLEASGDAGYYLTFHAEQTPSWDSRVTLNDSEDATGLRQIVTQPHQSPRDVEGIVRAHQLIGDELAKAGVGALEFLGDDPHRLVHESKFTLGHHIGTTRMSADPQAGVVDANLRVHNLDNLYVASASVFPTSSQAHPTLTLLALCMRLANHLAEAKAAAA